MLEKKEGIKGRLTGASIAEKGDEGMLATVRGRTATMELHKGERR